MGRAATLDLEGYQHGRIFFGLMSCLATIPQWKRLNQNSHSIGDSARLGDQNDVNPSKFFQPTLACWLRHVEKELMIVDSVFLVR